ncbi:hypothetical protein IMCC3317_11870 [Kordia antarctica]|uniref:Uncharacterized protein n=1 Tax=Kordia antarctica TaxID=1218801 RepID=A0A7L4ZHC6_9FLAO|nr:hypothetical protein IMCC3317_11870 [Kordia antarctica]
MLDNLPPQFYLTVVITLILAIYLITKLFKKKKN